MAIGYCKACISLDSMSLCIACKLYWAKTAACLELNMDAAALWMGDSGSTDSALSNTVSLSIVLPLDRSPDLNIFQLHQDIEM